MDNIIGVTGLGLVPVISPVIVRDNEPGIGLTATPSLRYGCKPGLQILNN